MYQIKTAERCSGVCFTNYSVIMHKPYIKTIYLYGSCARGEEKYSSDVDLFLELSESFRSRPELKKYLYLLKSEVSSEELDDAETDLKIVVGDDWKRNKMLYYTNVRKEGIQIWP